MNYLSDTDKTDIAFAVANDFDFLAASFVRSSEDVKDLRAYLASINGKNIKIISKIENRQGVDNIDEILAVSDGIMVARGDMGVEIPIREVPAIQKKIIKKVYLH
jgi:pyruvate kinase